MGQKHKRFRESQTPFPLRDIRKNPRSMYARVPQVMAEFVLRIEKLSNIMGPSPILEMARAYGLRPRLWLLVSIIPIYTKQSRKNICIEEKVIIQLTFNPVLALTGFRTILYCFQQVNQT